MFPLRGLWNRVAVEGDQFVNVECDWLVSPPGNAVQFSLSGNSPVALSQIVALAVDNGRCGADVDFIFPDSGFVLTVPAHNQGVFPVFTNALMFYASAPASAVGDITIFQILNSLPPPIPIAPSEAQNHVQITGEPITVGSLVVVPAGVNGTLNTLSLSIAISAGAGGENGQFQLFDGTGRVLWSGYYVADAATAYNIPVNLSGMSLRFINGINLVTLAGTTLTGGINVNVYYSIP
jgi:hypothetical protein